MRLNYIGGYLLEMATVLRACRHAKLGKHDTERWGNSVTSPTSQRYRQIGTHAGIYGNKIDGKVIGVGEQKERIISISIVF